MASNQLPIQIRRNLDEKMDLLFGRVLTGFRCPLGYQSRLELGWCNLDLADVERVRAVMHLGVLLPTIAINIFVDYSTGPAIASHGLRGIRMRLFGRDAPDADPVLIGMVNKPMPTSRAFIASRLGQPIARDFFKWLDEAVSLSNDINIAMSTYADIMKMSRTAGHLHRVCPELYSLSNLRPLPRASAIPHEWSSYPRRPVEWLVQTISKCLLLPESDAKWSKRSEYTWPVVGE